jgi:enterochelin esterase-like enzyme
MKYKYLKIIGVALGLILATQAYQLILMASTTQFEPPQQRSTATVSQATPLSYHVETYQSSVMGGTRKYGLCLPPNYQQNPQKRYPVIFLLHGGDGDQTDWFQRGKGDALPTLQELYAVKKLPLSIIVTPDGNDLRGRSRYRDPQYIDGPNGKVSTAIGDELVRVIQSRYRTLPTPKFWAIGGLSSGAWGAVNVGLQHLNHFSTLFSHSGYFIDASGAANSPLIFVKTLSPEQRQQLRIYLDVGKTDEPLYITQNQQFHQELEKLKISNVFRQFPGQHSWRFWRKHLADSLVFVGKQWQAEGLTPN